MLQEFIKDNLPPWIYTVYEKIQAALPNPIKPWFTVIIVLIVISFLIYGFRKRIKIIFAWFAHFVSEKKDKIYIGISISKNIDDKIIEFGNKISAKKIVSAKIKFIEVNQRFASIEDANNYVKNNLTTLVWSNGVIEKGGHLRIYITHPDDKNKIFSSALRSDFQSLYMHGEYAKLFPDTLDVDVDLEKGMISDAAIYTASCVILFFVGTKVAEIIFEELINKLQTASYKNLAEKKLHEIYSILSSDAGIRRNKTKALLYAQKASAIFPHDKTSLANLALAKYLNGDEGETEKLIGQLRSQYPHDPIALINGAYLAILKKNYKKVIKLYREYISIHDPSIDTQIAAFMDERVKENPSENAFLYARALSQYLLGNNEPALKDFGSFIRRADPIKYKPLIIRAKYFLKELHKKVK